MEAEDSVSFVETTLSGCTSASFPCIYEKSGQLKARWMAKGPVHIVRNEGTNRSFTVLLFPSLSSSSLVARHKGHV